MIKQLKYFEHAAVFCKLSDLIVQYDKIFKFGLKTTLKDQAWPSKGNKNG